MQQDQCLGITIPPDLVRPTLDSASAFVTSLITTQNVVTAAYQSGVRVWFEACSLNAGQLSDAMQSQTLADVGIAPPPPPAAPAPVTPAPTIYTFKVYHTGGAGLNVRAAPNRKDAFRYKIPEGGNISIVCQLHGDRALAETDVWDRLVDGNYAYDEYVTTPLIGVFSIRAC